MTKEVADFRRALKEDAPRIHAALMALVEEGNPQAVIYAHQRVFGKPPAAEEDRDALKAAGAPSRELVDAALKALAGE